MTRRVALPWPGVMREVPSTRSWDQSKGGMGAGVRFAVLSYESTVQRCLDHQQKTMRVSEKRSHFVIFFRGCLALA